MAKKSFINTDNPALNFISKASIDKVDGGDSITTSTGKRKAPEGYKLNHEYIETKSKRVQILVQPSLYKDAKAISEELEISLNDFIHRAIQEATYNETTREHIEESIEV